MGISGYDQEFIAAPTDQDVRAADHGVDSPGHLPQNLISNAVPVAIVDFLEIVKINHIEDQVTDPQFLHLVRPQSMIRVARDGSVKESAISGPSKRIGCRGFVEYLVGLGQFSPQ